MGALHEGIIWSLGMETLGFPQALRKFLKENVVGSPADVDEYVHDWIRIPDRRPDGFRIDKDDRRVIIVEVEVGGPLTEPRLRDWAGLWDSLATEAIELVLLVVDRFGAHRQVDLENLDMYFLAADTKR